MVIQDNFITALPAIIGFDAKYLGFGIVKYVIAGNGSITQTGSNIVTQFSISRPHRIKRLELLLTNSSNAADNTGCTMSFDKVTYSATNTAAGTYLILWASPTSVAASSFVEIFDEGFENNENTSYILNSNATNTDLLFVTIIVEYLEYEDVVQIDDSNKVGLGISGIA
jgi:hypothetical protein